MHGKWIVSSIRKMCDPVWNYSVFDVDIVLCAQDDSKETVSS